MPISRKVLLVAGGLALLACVWYWHYCWRHPFGDRTCWMPCTITALHHYAERNDGWFPRGMPNAVDCLRVLVPRYLDAPKLAGFSADKVQVVERLQKGEPLNESVSSWIYWPGFRIDDPPHLAIIWERTGGVNGVGWRTRLGSHVVGFVHGDYDLISGEEWPAFLREQEQIRSNVLSGRLNRPK